MKTVSRIILGSLGFLKLLHDLDFFAMGVIDFMYYLAGFESSRSSASKVFLAFTVIRISLSPFLCLKLFVIYCMVRLTYTRMCPSSFITKTQNHKKIARCTISVFFTIFLLEFVSLCQFVGCLLF